MTRRLQNPQCAIEQAVAVIGDWWSLLILRDLAGGVHRFAGLQSELRVSTKVLSQRLSDLVRAGVVQRALYRARPPRYEYHLTERGRDLIPVLIGLQSWGAQHLLGDGSLTATAAPSSPESQAVHALCGRRIPRIELPASHGAGRDVVDADRAWTVIYCYPGAVAPGQSTHPDGWTDIPGAAGCTLESQTYRDNHRHLVDVDAAVHGVSTQRADQQRAFAEHAGLPFTLLSDVDLAFTAALQLPTFHAAGVERLKRLTLIVDRERVIRHVQFPIDDPAGSVHSAIDFVRRAPAERAVSTS